MKTLITNSVHFFFQATQSTDQREEETHPKEPPTVSQEEKTTTRNDDRMDELMKEIRDRSRLCAAEHANTARILHETDLIKGCILVFIVLLSMVFLLLLIEYWAVKRPLRFSLW